MPRKAKHARMARGDSPRPRRRSAAERGYGAEHQRMRATLLQVQPLCQVQADGCTGWSTDAHHLRYPARDLADYLAVCVSCHRHLEREK